MSQPSLFSRIMGCLLGGAVGDALGAPVEFMRLTEIRAVFGSAGVIGYRAADGGKGWVTDDTQMTLFTAEGLILAMERAGGAPDHDTLVAEVWSAYLRWLDTQGGGPGPANSDRGYLVTIPELRKPRGPGNTCLSALRTGTMGTTSSPINDSKGCGGVMRTAPAAFVSLEPFRLGVDLAAITHGHPSGYIAAGALNRILADLVSGADLAESVAAVVELLRHTPDAIEVRMALEAALDTHLRGVTPTPELVETLGGGWVAEEALAVSVYCALAATDFAHGVLLAVNHSGDSDSTGSITGQILGTQLGVEAIPAEWLDGLAEREVVERVARDLVEVLAADLDVHTSSEA